MYKASPDEHITQNKGRVTTLERLRAEKDGWLRKQLLSTLWLRIVRVLNLVLADVTAYKKQAGVSQIMQHCIIPRVRLSPVEAVFCARFIKQMHSLGTPHFQTLALYDKVSYKPTMTAAFALPFLVDRAHYSSLQTP